MKRKTKLIICLVVGIVLAAGPIWGVIGAVVGMILAFVNLSQSEPNVKNLAYTISLALYTTVAGYIACPIGVVTVVISSILLRKSQPSHIKVTGANERDQN